MRERENSHDLGGYLVTVDYNRSLEDRIVAGKYNLVSDFFTKNAIHFPTARREGKKEILVTTLLFPSRRFNPFNSKKAIEELDKFGYQPAGLDELLALGEAYPLFGPAYRETATQPYYDIVALGSIFKGPEGKLVPYVKGSRWRRVLNVSSFERYWSSHFGFLVYQKEG